MKKLTILHLSDTHSYHELINIPKANIVIFSGDESNFYNPLMNITECLSFLEWFGNLKIKHKIFIAGNHSAAIFTKVVIKEDFTNKGIIYLEDDYVTIEGLKIYGNPLTPTFGNWYFNKNRTKLDNVWRNVEEDVDIMITHGPPKGILDLSYDRNNNLEFCGDNALRNHVINRINPKLHCFGHIHNCKDIVNTGVLYRNGIYFSNAAAMEDGKFGKIVCHGNLFEIDENKNVKVL